VRERLLCPGIHLYLLREIYSSVKRASGMGRLAPLHTLVDKSLGPPHSSATSIQGTQLADAKIWKGRKSPVTTA
jgi:hypothetical protein